VKRLPRRIGGNQPRVDRGGHDVSLVCPENAPNSDVFGHNRKPRLDHENSGRHFDSRAVEISGAAWTDQILTSDQQTKQAAN
jgi:hypothetical protein